MFEPDSERDGLIQQQSGVLVFAATIETAQHQEKIGDIGFGAGPSGLQLAVNDVLVTKKKWLGSPARNRLNRQPLPRFQQN
jgi:hypothetical protein